MPVPSHRLSHGDNALERAIETLRHHHVANPRRADHQYFHAELLCVAIQPCHVFHYTFSNGFERFVVTRRAQICQICLSERLVAAFQLIRERNVFDLAFLVISQSSICYGLEGFRTTSTEVEDTGNAIFQNHRFTSATSPT